MITKHLITEKLVLESCFDTVYIRDLDNINWLCLVWHWSSRKKMLLPLKVVKIDTKIITSLFLQRISQNLLWKTCKLYFSITCMSVLVFEQTDARSLKTEFYQTHFFSSEISSWALSSSRSYKVDIIYKNLRACVTAFFVDICYLTIVVQN